MRQLIEQEFGVTYHPGYVPTLLRWLGWSPQKPKRRASERDDGAIEQWVERDWPRVKKARRLKASLAFLDETGFSTVPYVGRTWAPIGQTPVFKHRLRHRERVTVLGSLTLSPERRRCGLYTAFFPGRGVRRTT